MKQHSIAKNGFSLIEIMLATLVIAIGMFSIAGLFSTGITTSAKAEEDIESVAFADLIFGHLQSTNWNDIHTPVTLTDYDGTPLTIALNARTIYTNQFTQAMLGYQLNLQDDGYRTQQVSLQVWPFHSTNRVQHFYTEVYNWRRIEQ